MSNPRIVICRHAESIEDVDNSVYDLMPDLQIPLTERGVQQAQDFARVLTGLFNGTKAINFYSSPGVRNTQTLEQVLSLLPKHWQLCSCVEPLLVKQDWGPITTQNRPAIEAERYKIGVLRYTFPQGESAQQMIQRMSLVRDRIIDVQQQNDCEVVVLSHGFEFRVLLMTIFGWSEEELESYGNLKNCEYRILTRVQAGQYTLDRPLPKHGLPITRLSHV